MKLVFFGIVLGVLMQVATRIAAAMFMNDIIVCGTENNFKIIIENSTL